MEFIARHSDLSQLRGDILAPEPCRVLRVWIVQPLSSRTSVDLCLPIAYSVTTT